MSGNLLVPILMHLKTNLSPNITIKPRGNIWENVLRNDIDISDFNGDIILIIKIGWSPREVIKNFHCWYQNLTPISKIKSLVTHENSDVNGELIWGRGVKTQLSGGWGRKSRDFVYRSFHSRLRWEFILLSNLESKDSALLYLAPPANILFH